MAAGKDYNGLANIWLMEACDLIHLIVNCFVWLVFLYVYELFVSEFFDSILRFD